MLRDRFVLTLVAMSMLVVGCFALSWPTSLDAYDQWGFRIACGSGVLADYDQATIARRAEASTEAQNRSTANDYVDQCHSAVWWRRGWAGLLVLLGAGLSITLLLRWQREAPAERGST